MATWGEAFAAQAASDLDAYDLLTSSTLPSSHRLHYFQMWLEKLCKAYVYKTNVETLKTRHNVVAKILPRIITEHWRRIGFERSPNLAAVRELCRQMDLLHPQVDDSDRRPDNVEYPWTGDSGEVEVPARWKFPLVAALHSNAGRLLLKAASHLTRDPAVLIR